MPSQFQASDYGLYYQHDFRHRWLRPHLLYQKLEKFRSHTSLNIQKIGTSYLDRDINSIQWGSGGQKLLLWTQMHGNEPTATMAIIDLLNFLTASDQYNDLRRQLQKELSICIIPMLNPDGSEAFKRESATGIDLNRDVISRQMPESRVFMEILTSFKPHWGFNLHDQRNIFSAGDSGYPATISFLSAAADPSKTQTPAREKSMKLISALADLVEEHLPRHIGRYSDDFYPRALGDFFHQQEIPCVLIESGGFPDDLYRDQARKMNFLCLVQAFELLANGKYEEESTDGYFSIPENRTNFYDLIIRDCRFNGGGKTFNADLGLLIKEEVDASRQHLERKFVLKEVGDLRFHFGLHEKEGGVFHGYIEDLIIDQPANFSIELQGGQYLKFIKGVFQ